MAWAPPQVGQRKQDIITSIIYEGAERGWSDTYLASRLRDVLPLTDRQRTAVTVYRRSLRDQGIPPARAKMLVDRYTQRLKSQRAKTIARTERAKMETRSLHNTIGELPLEREWVSKSGCCVVCKALTGIRTSTVYGPNLPGPPAHPNCRCTEKVHKTTSAVVSAIYKETDGDGDGFVNDGKRNMRPARPDERKKTRQQRTRQAMATIRTAMGSGGGFKPATDEDRKRLRIPPAWTDVEVSEDPEGVNGLLARGRDSKGRRQGRYSAAHTEAQAAAKFNRVKRIAPALPRFDRQLKKDALTNDNAGALTIIRRLGMRLGGEGETGADVKAYGANTLERRHVSVEGRKVTFDFIGKKGVHITITSSDPEVLRVVKSRLGKDGNPDDQLFPSSNVDSIRAYLRKYMPEETLVKDLRTIRANELALEAISGMGRAKTMTEYKKLRLQVGEIVSGQLGNNRSEALKSYINPTVFLMLLPEGVDPQL